MHSIFRKPTKLSISDHKSYIKKKKEAVKGFNEAINSGVRFVEPDLFYMKIVNILRDCWSNYHKGRRPATIEKRGSTAEQRQVTNE